MPLPRFGGNLTPNRQPWSNSLGSPLWMAPKQNSIPASSSLTVLFNNSNSNKNNTSKVKKHRKRRNHSNVSCIPSQRSRFLVPLHQLIRKEIKALLSFTKGILSPMTLYHEKKPLEYPPLRKLALKISWM